MLEREKDKNSEFLDSVNKVGNLERLLATERDGVSLARKEIYNLKTTI